MPVAHGIGTVWQATIAVLPLIFFLQNLGKFKIFQNYSEFYSSIIDTPFSFFQIWLQVCPIFVWPLYPLWHIPNENLPHIKLLVSLLLSNFSITLSFLPNLSQKNDLYTSISAHHVLLATSRFWTSNYLIQDRWIEWCLI